MPPTHKTQAVPSPVTDGTQTANINLVGQYEATSFQATADNGMGTLIEYVYTGVTPTV